MEGWPQPAKWLKNGLRTGQEQILMGQLVQKLDQILAELQRQNDGRALATREIMSIPQAAEYLGLSVYTLREWVRMGKVPFSRINKTVRLRKSKLDKWLERNEISQSTG